MNLITRQPSIGFYVCHLPHSPAHKSYINTHGFAEKAHPEMPRQRRSAPAPRTQTRLAHTASAPAAAPHYPSAHPAQPPVAAAPVQSQGPGLFGQMALTAAGVAVGSAVGHTIGAGLTGIFGGSSSPAPAAEQQVVQAAPAAQQQTMQQSRACDGDARMFTKCLEDNDGNMQVCDYYLQQLRACQDAAKQYTA